MFYKENYDDILYLARPASAKYKAMDKKSRAAQFASFAALKGHKESIERLELMN